MSELNLNKTPKEEINPVVLGMKADEVKEARGRHETDDQEALWSRSLEFFERMNVTTPKNR